MNAPQERILLVENNPDVSDLIARQTLLPMGYRVEVVGAAAQAIQEAVRFAPDAIIANLNLPGLSGKDLLVALSSQGLDVPVIVVAEKGMEGDVVQAFRLGASDFLYWPVREAEVVSAVERVFKQVRARREREMLARQLKQTNQELQRRVRELTTIFAIGKAVTSITDQRTLFDKIVEGAVYITEADSGWLLLRNERGKAFILSAYRNLPTTVAAKIDQPWDDGISSLVALSGESLSIHGDPLKRFKVSRLGQSILVVPVKVKKEVVGLLVLVRKIPQPFGASNQALLEAVADYASISLVNARLFKAIEERARSLQQAAENSQYNERILDEMLQEVSRLLHLPLLAAKGCLDGLLEGQKGTPTADQVEALRAAQDKLAQAVDVVDSITIQHQADFPAQRSAIDLNDLTRQVISRSQRTAQHGGVALFTELSAKPIMVHANQAQIAKVIEGLLSNAIKFSPQGGQVTVRVDRTNDNQAYVMVQDNGIGIDSRRIPHIFELSHEAAEFATERFGGLGIGLALVKEIVTVHGGKIWVESKPKEGSTFHFTLPSSI
jgi:signal transduction histidine kinase/DNA-binding response OmpR family regulator